MNEVAFGKYFRYVYDLGNQNVSEVFVCIVRWSDGEWIDPAGVPVDSSVGFVIQTDPEPPAKPKPETWRDRPPLF